MSSKSKEKERVELVSEAKGIVLEIGFGSGLNLPYYQNISTLYALEPSLELYKLTDFKQASFPIQHLEASAEKIPLPDASVDYVVSAWTLCSIPNPDLALKEIYRVLKPTGKFLFVEHGKARNKYIRCLQRLGTFGSKCMCGGCHLDREIDWLIINAGFTFDKIESPTNTNNLFRYKGTAKRMETEIRGVIFIITRDNKFLLQQRDGNSKLFQYYWCFPGGGSEEGEDYADTLVREVKEEHDVSIKSENVTLLMVHKIGGRKNNVYICPIDHLQEPVFHEGADMKWATLAEIKKLEIGYWQGDVVEALEKFLKK